MKFLALEREVAGVEENQFASRLEAEARRIWELYQSGKIRELYFRKERETAVLVLECRAESEARAILCTLPLVKAGLIDFELIPLIPYPGFQRLFTRD